MSINKQEGGNTAKEMHYQEIKRMTIAFSKEIHKCSTALKPLLEKAFYAVGYTNDKITVLDQAIATSLNATYGETSTAEPIDVIKADYTMQQAALLLVYVKVWRKHISTILQSIDSQYQAIMDFKSKLDAYKKAAPQFHGYPKETVAFIKSINEYENTLQENLVFFRIHHKDLAEKMYNIGVEWGTRAMNPYAEEQICFDKHHQKLSGWYTFWVTNVTLFGVDRAQDLLDASPVV